MSKGLREVIAFEMIDNGAHDDESIAAAIVFAVNEGYIPPILPHDAHSKISDIISRISVPKTYAGDWAGDTAYRILDAIGAGGKYDKEIY